MSDLVGELATRSDEFRVRWARHDVRLHRSGTKTFHHPVVGELTLEYNTIPLPADAGLSVTCYTPEPATPTEEKLALLASWVATPGALAPRRPARGLTPVPGQAGQTGVEALLRAVKKPERPSARRTVYRDGRAGASRRPVQEFSGGRAASSSTCSAPRRSRSGRRPSGR